MSDEALDRATVEALQRQLSMLSEPAVREEYVRAHAACCIGHSGGGGLPSPAEIQRLLSAWKVLWRWRQNSPRR